MSDGIEDENRGLYGFLYKEDVAAKYPSDCFMGRASGKRERVICSFKPP